MITRKKRNLIGSVRRVETNFAVYEIVDGNPLETRHQSAGYELYDADGKLTEESSPYRLMMEDSYKDIYIYNAQGELIEREEYDENESLIGKTIFEQSGDKRIEKHYYFDRNGEIKLRRHTVYDLEDNITEIAYYGENEQINPKRFYKSNPLEKYRKNTLPDGEGYTVEEFRYNEKNEFSHRILTIYDAEGNLKEHLCYESDGTLYLKDEYIYEYDSIGNWIKQIQSHWIIGWGEFRLVPLTVSRRKIDYYQIKK